MKNFFEKSDNCDTNQNALKFNIAKEKKVNGKKRFFFDISICGGWENYVIGILIYQTFLLKSIQILQ